MKKYAIEVFFDSNFDNYVRILWNKCKENNYSSFMTSAEGVEPHIALAVYNEISSKNLIDKFNDFIKTELIEFDLIFDALAVFPVSKVTFLQPKTSHSFIDLMHKVHTYFSEFEENCDPYYTENRWFPHVTIAYNDTQDEMKRTFNFIVDHFKPLSAKVQRLGLVEITYEGSVNCETLISIELKKQL